MPKFVLNAAGDQFFLPDSSQFYWDDLQGPKIIRYVPNTDHGMGRSDAFESAIAFYSMILNDRPMPEYTWSMTEDGTLQVETKQTPTEVRLWQATNPNARDFRVESLGRKYTSEVLSESGDGIYRVKVYEPTSGWTAYFVELTYDVGAPKPLKVTTAVKVAPNLVPFKDKDPSQKTSITITCTAPTPEAAIKIANDFPTIAEKRKLGDVLTETISTTCYLNFVPVMNKVERQVAGVMSWLPITNWNRAKESHCHRQLSRPRNSSGEYRDAAGCSEWLLSIAALQLTVVIRFVRLHPPSGEILTCFFSSNFFSFNLTQGKN